MIDYKFSTTEKDFLMFLGSMYKGKPLNSYMVLKKYVCMCGDAGLACNIESSEYYLFFLDNAKVAMVDSSLPKLLTTINLLNKLLQSNDLFCLDKEEKELKENFFLADIESAEQLGQINEEFRFKLNNDNRFHEFNMISNTWRIYSNNSYQGNFEKAEKLSLSNQGDTLISFMLNSTMVISNDLWKYIKNGCKTDEELYNEKEAAKSKKSLFWSRFAAGVACITLIVNMIATYYTREQAFSAEERADASMELATKNTTALDSIMQLKFEINSIDSTVNNSKTTIQYRKQQPLRMSE